LKSTRSEHSPSHSVALHSFIPGEDEALILTASTNSPRHNKPILDFCESVFGSPADHYPFPFKNSKDSCLIHCFSTDETFSSAIVQQQLCGTFGPNSLQRVSLLLSKRMKNIAPVNSLRESSMSRLSTNPDGIYESAHYRIRRDSSQDRYCSSRQFDGLARNNLQHLYQRSVSCVGEPTLSQRLMAACK
jgi:hypothetical protein